ncbi:MAG: type II secretion system F family protein [Pseudomonadales bacterium]|nr:type II secretion system F family protein [Pseudomonadales bacterium]
MSNEMMLFIGLIFSATFLLMAGLTMPVFGENRKAKKRIQARVSELVKSDQKGTAVMGLRKDALENLSPWEKDLESLAIFMPLKRAIAQSGDHIPAYRLVAIACVFSICAAVVAWILTHFIVLVLIAALAAGAVPFLKIYRDRDKRLDKFEEQLPEALDVVKRALQAGHPFNASLSLVAEEMEDPIAGEFEQVFADINYGNNVKWALLSLLARVPSVNVMAVVTSVLIQRETGGNLAEILEKISYIIRQRFKFHRKVKTMSAEGRMSAWILCLVPFVLFIIIWLTTPDYLKVLYEDELGHKLIMYSAIGMFFGIIWIRKIIRIEV